MGEFSHVGGGFQELRNRLTPLAEPEQRVLQYLSQRRFPLGGQPERSAFHTARRNIKTALQNNGAVLYTTLLLYRDYNPNE